MKKILLVFLFVVVVFANENNQIPQILKSSGKIYSAILIPNCKGFYTYKNGKVTKCQLNPIQPVESFVFQKNIKSSHGLRENIFVTKDAKRLIYKSRDKEYSKVADFRYYPMNMIVGKDILHVNYAIEAYYLDLKTLKTIDFSHTNYEDRIWVENAKNQNRKSILRDLKNNITAQLRMNPNRKKYFKKYKHKFNPIVWDAYMNHPIKNSLNE